MKVNIFVKVCNAIKAAFISAIKFIKRFWKIIVGIILIVAIVLIGKYVYNYFYDKKYKPYEEKMHTYGFDKMYDNQSARSSEKVTHSEAIKMIIASIYNVYDVSGFAYDTQVEYPNMLWVDYAQKQKIISNDDITKDNESNNVKYIDVIKYYIDARAKLLNKKVQYDKEASFSDLKKYNTDMQDYINDAAKNKLINDSNKKLNADKLITKAQLNMLVVNFVEQYNTITLKGDKINVNPDKVPSNANEYPYTLSNVDKSVYELPLTYEDPDITANPIETYIIKKEYYSQIKEFAEYYYNYILNIDYETITADDIKEKINDYTMYGVYDDDVNAYVDYVKNHKIKLSGSAKAQLPIIYYDGLYYRVRMKIDLNVISSDTKDNLLYQDLKNDKAYTYKDKNTFIIDAKLGNAYKQNTIYLYPAITSTLIIE